jgi:hypothetical protein
MTAAMRHPDALALLSSWNTAVGAYRDLDCMHGRLVEN